MAAIKTDLNRGKVGRNYITHKNQDRLRESLLSLKKCGVKNVQPLLKKMRQYNFIETNKNWVIVIEPKYWDGNAINAKLVYGKDVPELKIKAYVHFRGLDFEKLMNIVLEDLKTTLIDSLPDTERDLYSILEKA